MRALLIPVNGGPAIKFDKPILLVGRHPDCDIVLIQSRKISRKHCCLALIEDHIVVRDLESMNGVMINGQATNREGKLSIGDTLQIGDVKFKLSLEDGSAGKKVNLMEGVSTEQETAAEAFESDVRPRVVAASQDLMSQEFPVVVDDPDEDSEEFEMPPLFDP